MDMYIILQDVCFCKGFREGDTVAFEKAPQNFYADEVWVRCRRVRGYDPVSFGGVFS